MFTANLGRMQEANARRRAPDGRRQRWVEHRRERRAGVRRRRARGGAQARRRHRAGRGRGAGRRLQVRGLPALRRPRGPVRRRPGLDRGRRPDATDPRRARRRPRSAPSEPAVTDAGHDPPHRPRVHRGGGRASRSSTGSRWRTPRPAWTGTSWPRTERQIAQALAAVLGDRMRELGLDSGGAEVWAFGVVGMVQLATQRWFDQRTHDRRRARRLPHGAGHRRPDRGAGPARNA